MRSLSMKTNCVAFATFLVASIPFSSQAEQSSNENSEVNNRNIVITANRTEQNINDTLAAVEIITREDIDRLQPESIVDLLTNIAGFDIARSGGAGQTSSLFTRGSNSDHTLILVDGIRVGSATLGNKSFATIPVAQIERIEIVKGPRAALWGSDAIAGVIQIFTRRLAQGEYSVDITAGTDKFKSSNFSIGFGNEDITNTVTLSIEDSDGFDVFDDSSDTNPDSEPDNDGYQRISAAIRGDYKLSDATTLDWVFQYDEGDASFDNSFGANENEYSNHLWNIRYTYVFENWQSQFSVKQSRDKAFSFDSRTADKVGSTFITKRNQINALTKYTFSEAISVSAGVDHYEDDISGSESLQFDGSFAGFDETKRTFDGVFAGSVMNIGRFVGEISARYDDIESVGSEQTFNLSAGYKVLDNVTIAATRSKGFKAPTFNDQYFPGFSNPDLKSEVSYNTEFLIKANWENQSLTLVNYDNQVSRLITFVFNPVTFAFLPINLEQASLKGQEAVYQLRQGAWSHKLSASLVKAKDKSIDALTGLPKNEQLLRRAKEYFSYELSADLGDLSFFAQINYTGGRRDNNFSTFPATAVNLKSYTSISVGGSYDFNKNLSVKLKVSDLSEAENSTVFSYNTPGRQVFLSIQYRNF